MSHIDVSPSAGNSDATSGLYLAEPASDRLLLVIEADAANSREVAALAKTVTTEGWNVLHLACAATSQAEAIAADITDALMRAALRLALPPTRQLQIVAIADGAAAHPACIAVVRSHRQTTSQVIRGLVTVDAFASVPPSAAPISDIAAALAEIDGLATVIVARRSSSEARRSGLSYHQRLQSNGRETHYLVLAENHAPLLAQLSDAQGALGREIRWLLDPVHSRNGA